MDQLPRHPGRVVCLVPSLTESMFDLQLGKHVVGITDYCIHPAKSLSGIRRVGGTKNSRVEDILSLHPDLVIANQEENSQEVIERLRTTGVQVWLTFPKTVREALEDLWKLAEIFSSEIEIEQLRQLEKVLELAEWAIANQEDRIRYFCPIWQQIHDKEKPWWMVFNDHTYSGDLLRLLGGENIFATRERKYPLSADLNEQEPESPRGRDTRYPRVSMEEINALDPELILLPDEPYPFGVGDKERIFSWFSNTSAGRRNAIQIVDGTLITWHGTRLARALTELNRFSQPN